LYLEGRKQQLNKEIDKMINQQHGNDTRAFLRKSKGHGLKNVRAYTAWRIRDINSSLSIQLFAAESKALSAVSDFEKDPTDVSKAIAAGAALGELRGREEAVEQVDYCLHLKEYKDRF
jgi:hypothetical protein